MTSISDLEERVAKLEAVVFDTSKMAAEKPAKATTLAEIARKPALKDANGQQKIAAIVGYFEIISGAGASDKTKIREAWSKAKFVGKYNSTLVDRAVGILLRELDNNTYDLTQAGEDFFKELLK